MNRRTRKLQEVGGGTFTVSVPKDWAAEHGLTAGASINLYSHIDGSLVVRGADEEGTILQTATIELDAWSPALVERMIETAYTIGFQSFILYCDAGWTDDQRRAAIETTQRLPGIEITTVEETTIELRIIIDSEDVSIQQSISQLQFVTLAMYRTAMDALLRDRSNALDRLTEREDEADRMFALVTRYFNRSLITFEDLHQLNVRRSELFDFYTVAHYLEAISDQAQYIGTFAEQTDITVPTDVRAKLESLTADISELVEDATNAVLSTPRPSTPNINEILIRHSELRSTIEELDQDLLERSASDIYAITKFLTELRCIVDHAGRIAEIALQANNRPTPTVSNSQS